MRAKAPMSAYALRAKPTYEATKQTKQTKPGFQTAKKFFMRNPKGFPSPGR
jgi:hypothetical protein